MLVYSKHLWSAFFFVVTQSANVYPPLGVGTARATRFNYNGGHVDPGNRSSIHAFGLSLSHIL